MYALDINALSSLLADQPLTIRQLTTCQTVARMAELTFGGTTYAAARDLWLELLGKVALASGEGDTGMEAVLRQLAKMVVKITDQVAHDHKADLDTQSALLARMARMQFSPAETTSAACLEPGDVILPDQLGAFDPCQVLSVEVIPGECNAYICWVCDMGSGHPDNVRVTLATSAVSYDSDYDYVTQVGDTVVVAADSPVTLWRQL